MKNLGQQFEAPASSETLRVAGEENEAPGSLDEKKTLIEVPDELKGYQEAAQRLIDGHRRFFASFARDVSLGFKVSNGFYIDLEKGDVHLDTKWFAEKGFTERQTLWAVLHELSHFRDLAEDPEKMLANFGYIRTQARKTGAKMMEKWKAKYGGSDSEFIEKLGKKRPDRKHPERAMNPVEAAAYKMHHTFYNVFDDIYVNSMVARRAPAFEEDSRGGDEIEKLYREKLFAATDYRETPRHLQFLYALLRKEMVPGEELELGDDVREVLGKKLKFQGKMYTPAELVGKFLKPGKRRDTKAGKRYFILQMTLEPLFEELLAKDLDEWEPEKPPEPPEGGGQGIPGKGGEPVKGGEPGEPVKGGDPNPFAPDYDDFSENSPDQLDEDDMEDWLNKNEDDKRNEEARKAKEEAEENKTPEERAAESSEAQDRAWCEANGVKYKDLRRFRGVEAEVAPHLDALAGLWDRIIFGSSREIERGKEGHFMTGSELDVQEAIREWPKIAKGRFEDVRVMKRDVAKEKLVKKPELIRVRLVADQSGSMDAAKRRVLERCVVLLLSSVREFNTKLNLTRSETRSELEADTEVWGFGSRAEKLKALREGGGYDDEYAGIVRAFGSLRRSMGSTADHLALRGIADGLTSEECERIEDGKVLDIVFEITDGGSDDVSKTRGQVDGLLDTGLIARAFQIGKVSESERADFERVWNDGREDALGQVVGESVEDLVPAVAEALKKHLEGIRL